MLQYPQKLELVRQREVDAVVEIPGSKSITNRAFVLSALADGETVLIDPLLSDDTVVMSQCLTQLGVSIRPQANNDVTIIGRGGTFSAPHEPLFVGNSGTTIRFLTAVAALTPNGAEVTLDGVSRMRQRPIVDLIDALRQLGVDARATADGCPPVKLVGGGIYGGETVIKGSISSQYLSAVLMAAPYADKDVRIVVDGELVSRPYVDMTIEMMQRFGVDVERCEDSSFFIPARQSYIGQVYEIEPDASNASYFLAAAAVTGGSVTVNGLSTHSIQGDNAFIDVLEMMGCTAFKNADSFTVHGGSALSAVDFNASLIPDMAQTIAVVALFAKGTTRLTGLKTLRVKETDRIHALAVEMRKIGAEIVEGDDFLIITPPRQLYPAAIDTYEDHRMAMSFAIAGLRVTGLSINDPGCVAKTFPDFWQRWERAFPGATRSFEIA